MESTVEIPSIDPSYLNQLRVLSAPGAESLVAKVIQIFMANTPVILQSIEEALGRQEFEVAGRAAHKLKSGAGNVGAIRLTQLRNRLEKFDAADPCGSRSAIFGEIRSEYSRIELELLRILSSEPSS